MNFEAGTFRREQFVARVLVGLRLANAGRHGVGAWGCSGRRLPKARWRAPKQKQNGGGSDDERFAHVRFLSLQE